MNQHLSIQWESEEDSENEGETSVPTHVLDVEGQKRVASPCAANEGVSSSSDCTCIQIDSLKWTESSPSLLSPWIRIHLCEESSGKCVNLSHDNTVTSGHSFQTTTVPTYQDSLLFTWTESIIIPIPYSKLVDTCTIILFEVLAAQVSWTWPDSTSISATTNKDHPLEQEQPLLLHHHQKNQSHGCLAWAFLRARAIGMDEDYHDFKLQLYRYQSHNGLTKHMFPWSCLNESCKDASKVFHQYQAPKRILIDGFLQVSARPMLNPYPIGVNLRMDERMCYHEICPPEVMFEPCTKGTRSRRFRDETFAISCPLLKRDPLEPFHVVDTLHAWLPSSSLGINTHGANVLSFSSCGKFLAVAVLSKMSSFITTLFYQILIYRVLDGDRVMIIDSCHHDFVSDLTWHHHEFDDCFLLVSSSLDGTIQSHSIPSVAICDKSTTTIQEFPPFARTKGIDPCTKRPRFFYPDNPGKPCRVMFLGSLHAIPSSTGLPCLLLCGCTNASITLWDISSESHHSLGYVGGEDSLQRYHQSEITAFYKPIDEKDKVTFYSGDAMGCITGWKRAWNGDGISLSQNCRGVDFAPLFYVTRNNILELRTCSIIQLSMSSIMHQDDSSSNEVTGPLLGILVKDVSSHQVQLLVYDWTSRRLIKSLELVCDESYEYITSVCLSPDAGRYLMCGSNLGRLYLWDCIQGCRIKSAQLDRLCVSHPIKAMSWNPTYQAFACSLECQNGPTLVLTAQSL